MTALTAEQRAAAEVELARTYRMLFRYETLADDLPAPAAWLCVIGQCDCKLEILILERILGK